MLKKTIILLMLILCFCGCSQKEIKTNINEEKHVSINYPVTGINVLDEAISSYISNIYNNYKSAKEKKELNITYTYKEVNNDIINVSINTEMKTNEDINKIKTFTYDKQSQKFLSLENIVKDLEALDYDVKKALLEKYQDADMDFLSNVSLNYFTIDDKNLTIYLGPTQLNKSSEIIYLDIPLNSLKLLIDIDKSKDSDTYIALKKRNISSDDKIIALTFDDGPSKYTSKILDILKKYGACATFFVIGNKVDFYDEVLNRVLEEGSEIGNHSYSHKYLNRLSEKEFKEEINKTQSEIKKSTGFTPTIFRPSYGGYNDRLKSYTDLTFVLWDIDSRDWQVKSKDRIIKNILPNVKDGSIILMHDNHEYSVNALDDVIKNLQHKGYKFVTISELLELKNLRENE